MKLVYYCNYCQALLDELEVEELDEDSLGFSSLTSLEKKDIIKIKREQIEVGIICDQCEQNGDLLSLLNNNLLH